MLFERDYANVHTICRNTNDCYNRDDLDRNSLPTLSKMIIGRLNLKMSGLGGIIKAL